MPTIGAAATQASAGVPRGVFSLGKAGQATDPAVFASPSVDGISVRQTWTDLEKTKGDFDWSFLDSEVANAEKSGKAVLIRILSDGPSTPSWVYRAGVQTFTYADKNPYHHQNTGKFALFWDKTFLAEKKAMIEAVGKHLSGNSAVKIVAAVTASSHSGDWHVPHSPIDIQNWHAVGYTSDKLLDVCKEIIDTTIESFPNQYVLLSVGPNGKLDRNPEYLSRQVVQYGRTRYPGRMIVERNSLSAVSPLPVPGRMKHFQVLWDNRPDIAGQMLWFTYGDPTCRNNGRQKPCDPEATLKKSVDIGVAYGMRFIEIYQRDVTSLPAVIRYAHEALTK
ncbi:MAG TPA: beta-galactosidase [Chthoniobacterales bacterium]|nr:beta-galactosidase [Chthoniobacterales bacterium]